MKHALFAAALGALAAFPLAAHAQSDLDRLETASEAMGDAAIRMMAREVAANGGDPAPLLAAAPDMSWDAPMRAAGACMIEAHEAEIGAAGVEEMLGKMEGFVARIAALDAAGATISEVGEPDVSPTGMSMERSQQIAMECGMVEQQMKRMQASGFAAAMMRAAQGG
ncbi:hypothetical protein ACQ5SO_13130 [Rhodovulum sp. DZ06]|uniref:hypothetical protein n=1 Tax=Rhodovulum sp. DZ06 TaxID=3425126 RepID=UPI003D343503